MDYTNINTSSTSIRGNITDNEQEEETNVYFEYRQQNETEWNKTYVIENHTTGVWEEFLTGLDSDTMYEYRAVLEYEGNTYKGEVSTFTTFREFDILGLDFERNQENVFLLAFITLLLLGMWYIGIIHGAEHFVMFSAVMLFALSFIILSNDWGLFMFLLYMLTSLLLATGYYQK